MKPEKAESELNKERHRGLEIWHDAVALESGYAAASGQTGLKGKRA